MVGEDLKGSIDLVSLVAIRKGKHSSQNKCSFRQHLQGGLVYLTHVLGKKEPYFVALFKVLATGKRRKLYGRRPCETLVRQVL